MNISTRLRAATAQNRGASHACPAVIVVGHQSCFALKRNGVHAGAASVSPNSIPSGVGHDPSQLQSAYHLTSASAANGAGRTIAIVDAYDDANAASDLAGYISNSWGGCESSTESSTDSSYFTHDSGIVTTVSSGDSDYGVSYPATSPKVVSIGDTSLTTASNSRGWTESVWNTTPGSEGTGSGCSAYEAQPSWQKALNLPSGCAKRVDNDVAADADPTTGVALDSAGKALTYSATGLPAGLSISSSGGGGCTAAQLLGNPGFETSDTALSVS